ncbi:MAG: ATP-binding protein [Chroococcales cyanobacterium]
MMTPSSKTQKPLAEIIFAGDSAMAVLMRSRFPGAEGNPDASPTPLGPLETWPPSLKTAIGIILGSRYPMFIWWGQDLINFYNDAYIPMLGNRHPAALGQPAHEVWKELWHSLGPKVEDVLTQGQSSWNQEILEMVERNGYREEAYFTFSYSPIWTEEGTVGGVFCACSEDTRRVVDDRRLQTLNQLASSSATQAKTVPEACQMAIALLGNNPRDIPFALIYLFDSEQKQAQQVSATNLGISPGVSPAVIELGANHPSDCWGLNGVLATGEVTVIEGFKERVGPLPGGVWDEPPHSALVLPLTRPGQEPFGVLIVGINPYRPLDDDYRSFFNLVAGQVTTAIHNTLGYQEERKQAAALAELDDRKMAFLSNVSHEFRTPLTLILGPLEEALAQLEESEPQGLSSPTELKEQLQRVYRNGLRLLKLVNTLLDFSRIESDRLSPTQEPTDLATFTAEIASGFRSAIERAGLDFVIDCPPLPKTVVVNRQMWEKIVLNLLSNAFKFTFTGEIRLSLAYDKAGVPGNSPPAALPDDSPNSVGVCLEVHDTGIGIPLKECANLFTRFHQVKGAKGRSIEGSGIGLSLVKELVTLHGGTVEVSSVEGQGSCFRVLIPMEYAEAEANAIEATPADDLIPSSSPYLEEALQWLPQDEQAIASSENPPERTVAFSPAYSHVPHLQRSRILLVDDNADMRDYLKRLLQGRWEVETAANGAIALDRIQRQLPDLVLTDVMMPEVDGFQLLKKLRENEVTQSIPIILLSARAGDAATVEALAARADDYLIKPFSACELMARVETQLQMSRLRQDQSANRFKNEFLMTITHELQSPLALILGWVRLLQSQSYKPETLALALGTIERNAATQAKLIRNLLEALSLLSGQVKLKAQWVDLVSLIEGVVTSCSEAAQGKKILIIQNPLPLPEQRNVIVDGARLEQMIEHLLDNAIKFTPEGGEIHLQWQYLNSAELEIIVADTGMGIHPDFLPHIFQRFTQFEVPSRHSPGGVGIGLAIVYHLVKLYEGEIQVSSPGPGEGTTVILRLPLRRNAG